jgi:hypothetical protein
MCAKASFIALDQQQNVTWHERSEREREREKGYYQNTPYNYITNSEEQQVVS